MDNFEVHFGLTGAVWFFESFPKEAQCVRLASKAGQMAADLSKRLNVFELQLGGGSPYFGPLPNDTAALGVQGSHGYTNLMAVARLDPLPFRDKLFQLVETNPKIPQEFGNPPDEQRTLPENTYLPFWCLAVNRASLKESRQKYHEMLRSRVSYLVTQYKVMKQADVRIDNETRFIGRYAFRIQEYGLAVLAILSEFGPVKQLPDIPYLAKPEQR